MSKTVVGLFKDTAAAQELKQILFSKGYQPNEVSIVANDHEDDYLPSSSSTDLVEGKTESYGIGHKIGNFFQNLTGGDEHAHEHYATGVNSGGALLTVKAEDEEAEQIAMLLKQHGARDIEGGTSKATASETREFAGSGQQEEAVVGKNSRVVEEVLVGKQASEHTEAIHDTVRKTEVEVEHMAGQGIDKARS